MYLNEKIIKLRKDRNMTQEDLALRLGVSRQSISKWELGICDPDIQNLKEISKLFDVSFDYLLNDEKNEALPLKTLAEAPSAQNNSKKREEEIAPKTHQSANLIPAALILVGGIGLIVSIVIAFLNPHYSCWLNHKWIPNIMGYIIADWCQGAVLWRFGLFLPSLACIFGVLIYYYKERKKPNEDSQNL